MPRMTALSCARFSLRTAADSMSAIVASKLAEERATALDYYQGDMSKSMPAPARALQGSLDRYERHHRRADAHADGDLHRRR